MMVRITGEGNVRLMFNARPPDHIPTASSDTTIFRSHIAILRTKIDTIRKTNHHGPGS